VDLSAGARGTGNHEAGSGSTHPSEAMNMRVYTQPHRFYCGVDLHARTLLWTPDPNDSDAAARAVPPLPFAPATEDFKKQNSVAAQGARF
jgi:hypothetical protein